MSIKIRHVEEKDFVQLADFLQEGFPKIPLEQWKKRFHTWWKENPFMGSIVPRGWVLETDSSEIVGFIGNMHVKFLINGEKGLAAAASSWYVKPEFQGLYSVLLLLEFLKQKEIDLFLSTTPSEKVRKMNLKTGYVHTDLPFNRTEYWYIINYKKITNAFTKKRLNQPKVKLITQIMSPPISLTIKAILPFLLWLKKRQRRKFRTDKYFCSLFAHCDEAFTTLWENNRNDGTTTLYRDAETLNWLYFSDVVKHKRHAIKCQNKQDNNLVGYAAFDVVDDFAGIKILKLVDSYIPLTEEKIITSLIDLAISLAKKNHVDAVRLWPTNKEIDKILRRIIKIRKCSNFPYLYKFNQKHESKIKNNKSHIFSPSPIDPDRGIT